jgi:uncharacterized coiled-coil protein SlyX
VGGGHGERRIIRRLRATATQIAVSDNVSPIMESRLVDLEIRYTHLEQQYAELSQVVFEQQKSIAALHKEMVSLRGHMEELGEPIANERPPHY